MLQREADAIFDDEDKCLNDDVVWTTDEQHPLNFVFRGTVYCNDLELILAASINPIIGSVSFALIHPKEGRIYGLDIGGHPHRNLDGTRNGSKHKHRWKSGDPSWAYEPDDITATPDELEKLWREFFKEAKIYHSGEFSLPHRSKGLFDD